MKLTPQKKSTLFFVGIILCIFFQNTSNASELAVVSAARERVWARHHTDSVKILISKGYVINSETVIRTGANGYASIKPIDGSGTIILRPSTEVAFYAYRDEGVVSKSIKFNFGMAFLDLIYPRQGALKVITPTMVALLEQTKCIIVVSDNSFETTLFTLEGTAKVLGKNSDSWIKLLPEMAAFVSSEGLVRTDTIAQSEIPQLEHIIHKTMRFEQVPGLAHDVVIKSSAGGTVTPLGNIVALNAVGIDLNAAPAKGYQFCGWNIVDGNVEFTSKVQANTQIKLFSTAIIEGRFSTDASLITIESSGNGHIEPSGKFYVQKNSPLKVSLIPAPGYKFAGWQTNGQLAIKNLSEYESIISVSGSLATLMANFKQKTYTLTVKSNGKGNVKPKQQLVAKHGIPMEISAIADKGYVFGGWVVEKGHARIENKYSCSTTVICDSLSATIAANFLKNAVEVSVFGHEYATVSPIGKFYVAPNAIFEVSAVPKHGYKLKQWKVKGRGVVEGFEYAVVKCESDLELYPELIATSYSLSLIATRYGSVTPSKPLSVTHGSPFAISARPDKGKHFLRWKVVGGWANIAQPNNPNTTVTLTTSDAVLLAEFASSVCSLYVSATSGGSTEPNGVVKVAQGGEVMLEAIANPRAAFISWEIEGDDSNNVEFSDTVTSAEQTVKIHKGYPKVNAVFSTETAELTVFTNGLGTSKPYGKLCVPLKKWINLKALPNANQTFVEWTSIGSSEIQFKDPMAAETQIMLGGDAVVRAIFQPLADSRNFQHGVLADSQLSDATIQFQYDENAGTLDREKNISVKQGIPIEINAKAKDGFYFEQWIVNAGAAIVSNRYSPSTNVTITSGNAVISAIFKEKPIGTLDIQFKDYEGRTKTIYSKYR